ILLERQERHEAEEYGGHDAVGEDGECEDRDHPPPRHDAPGELGRRFAGVQFAKGKADDAGKDQQAVDRGDGDMDGRREEPCEPAHARSFSAARARLTMVISPSSAARMRAIFVQSPGSSPAARTMARVPKNTARSLLPNGPS